MTAEYFTIITRYNQHRTHEQICKVTQLQLEQLALRCTSQALNVRIASALSRLGRQSVPA